MRRFLLLVLLSCAAPPAREPPVLRIAVGGRLGDFSPINSQGSHAAFARPFVFQRLVTLDDAGELKPVLAASAERLPGGPIRVRLRDDVRFSDGSPLRAQDVIESLAPHGLRARQEGDALVIEANDPWILPEPLLLQSPVFRTSGGEAIGTGPFLVASTTENELRLIRRSPQPGRVNDVRLIAYPSQRDAFTHTLKGDANAMVDLESRWLEFFRDVPAFRILRGAGRTPDALVFNARLSRSERQRLAAVLESQRMRDLAYAPGECVEHGPLDVDLSLPPGPPLAVVGWGPLGRLALAARRVLGDRGGDLAQLPVPEAASRMRARDYDLLTLRPLQWPPAMMGMLWGTNSPDNPSGYSNPAFDRAAAAGDAAGMRQALREDPPAAFICTHPGLAVVDSRIQNARLGPYDTLETLPEWEFAP